MLEGRWHRRPGRLFAAYVAGYGLGRLWVESLRIDYAHTILGALVMGAVAMAWPMHERRVDEQIASAVRATRVAGAISHRGLRRYTNGRGMSERAATATRARNAASAPSASSSVEPSTERLSTSTVALGKLQGTRLTWRHDDTVLRIDSRRDSLNREEVKALT